MGADAWVLCRRTQNNNDAMLQGRADDTNMQCAHLCPQAIQVWGSAPSKQIQVEAPPRACAHLKEST